jgi:hypothetical protein
MATTLRRADTSQPIIGPGQGKPDLVETPAAGGKEAVDAVMVPHCAPPGGREHATHRAPCWRRLTPSIGASCRLSVENVPSMLPLPTLAASLTGLLDAFRSRFTTRGFDSFTVVVVGLIAT